MQDASCTQAVKPRGFDELKDGFTVVFVVCFTPVNHITNVERWGGCEVGGSLNREASIRSQGGGRGVEDPCTDPFKEIVALRWDDDVDVVRWEGKWWEGWSVWWRGRRKAGAGWVWRDDACGIGKWYGSVWREEWQQDRSRGRGRCVGGNLRGRGGAISVPC